MEIELNTSSIARREVTPPVTRKDPAAAATDLTSFTTTNSLEGQLREVAPTRVDKVALAKSLLNNPNYPPQELLDRIARLLALQNIQ